MLYRPYGILLIGMWTFLLFNSCKEEAAPPAPDRCCAELRILNLARQSPELDGYVSYYNVNERMISGLSFREVFPRQGFLEVDGIDAPGQFGYPTWRMQLVRSDSSLRIRRNILGDTTFIFDKGRRYLLFITDRGPNRPGWVIINDRKNPGAFDPKSTYIRLLQLGSQPNVYIRIVKTQADTEPRTNYGQMSGYLPLVPDFYTLQVYSGNTFLLEKPNVWLQAGKNYTFYYDGTDLNVFETEN